MKDLTQWTYEIIECENQHLKIEELLEQYANQRVIEELEELIDGLDEFELHSDFPYLINKRIKELKQ